MCQHIHYHHPSCGHSSDILATAACDAARAQGTYCLPQGEPQAVMRDEPCPDCLGRPRGDEFEQTQDEDLDIPRDPVALSVRQHWEQVEERNLRRAMRRSQKEVEDADMQLAAAASLILQQRENDVKAEEDLVRAIQMSLLECDEQEVRRVKEESLRSAYEYFQAHRAAGGAVGAGDDETVVSGSCERGIRPSHEDPTTVGDGSGNEGRLAGVFAGMSPDELASDVCSQRTTRQHPVDVRSQGASIHYSGESDTGSTASMARNMPYTAAEPMRSGDAARQHWQSFAPHPVYGVPGSEIPLSSPRGRPAAPPREGYEASPIPAHPDLPLGESWTMPPRRPGSPAATLDRVWLQGDLVDRQRRKTAETRWGPGYDFNGVGGDDDSDDEGIRTGRQSAHAGEGGAHLPGISSNMQANVYGCGTSSQGHANLDGMEASDLLLTIEGVIKAMCVLRGRQT